MRYTPARTGGRGSRSSANSRGLEAGRRTRSRKASCADMGAARRRILKVLGETGGRKRNVLDGLAGGDRRVLDELVRQKRVRIEGIRKGARYVRS